MKRAGIGFITIAICAAVAGCNGVPRPEGHYEGDLLELMSGQVAQQAVSEDVSYGSGGLGKIEIRGTDHAMLATLAMSGIEKDRFTLEIPGVASGLQLIRRDDHCFDTRAGTEASLCYDERRLQIEVLGDGHRPVYALTGDHFTHDAPPTLETPRQFSLSGAVAQAMVQDFGTRIQYEAAMAAKHDASAAYLELLPHLSFSTVLSNLPPTLVSILGAVGDLAPFLFPPNWFRANAAGLQADLERQTLTLMQADLATQVEGLTYSLARDEAIIGVYDALLPQVAQALAKTQDLEAHGQMPAGSALHLEAVSNSMQLDLSALGLVVEQDKAAIAEALGMNNPRSVIDVAIDVEPLPVEQAAPIDADALGASASARSLELEQMDTILAIAHLGDLEQDFAWLDPGGGGNGVGLNFGLGESLAAGQNHLQEMLLKRQQLSMVVLQKAEEAADGFNQALSAFALAKQGMELQQQRLELVTNEIQPGSTLNTMDYGEICQDYLETGIRLETLRSMFRIARSKVDRLMLQGFYQRVPVPALQ